MLKGMLNLEDSPEAPKAPPRISSPLPPRRADPSPHSPARQKSPGLLSSLFEQSSGKRGGAEAKSAAEVEESGLKKVFEPFVKPLEKIGEILPKSGTCGLCIGEHKHTVLVTEVASEIQVSTFENR